jgi:hypothetical protein
VTEATWRDGVKRDQSFIASESPFFIGRAVAALAADPHVARKAGGLYSSSALAEEYGFTDVDGARPNFGRWFAEHSELSPVRPRTPVRWELTRASG